MMYSRSWSDLPHELAKSIGACLDTKTDVSRFRAVCKSWRSSISPFEKHRCRCFPINGCLEKRQGCACYFTLSESVVYHLAPPEDPASDKANNAERGWLIKVEGGDDELGKSKSQLLHPLSQFFVSQLPKSYPKVINSLEFRVSELARMYRFDHPEYYGSLGCYKAAVSLDLNFPAVMIVSEGILYHGELELGVGGNNIEKSIKVSKLCDDGDYKDVIFFQGKFYVVCEDGTTVTVDSSLNVTVVASPILLAACSRGEKKKYLVESLGELLLIDKCGPAAKGGKYEDYVDVWMSSDIKLKVFKLNAEEKQWVEVNMKALDDRILIVGDDGSFSVSTKDFPGCLGNNIYFSTIDYDRYGKHHELEGMFNEIGVFRLDLGTHMPLLYYKNDNIFEPPPPTATRTLLSCSRKRKGDQDDQTTNLDLVAQKTQQKKPRRRLGGLAAVRLR